MDRTEYRLARPVINGKPSKKWYVLWRENGRERRISTRKEDRYTAERVLAKFLAEKSKPPERIDINWILDRYEEDRAKAKSIDRIKSHLRAVRSAMGASSPTDLNADSVRGYANRWRRGGLADGTIRTRLLLLRAALSWAEKMNYIDRAPFIPAPPPGAPRERHLTRDEFKRLYMAAEEPHIRTFLALGVLSGLRNGAILSLTWDQIDAEKRFIRPTGGSANKKRADIRIGPDLMLALGTAWWLRNGPYVVQWRGQQVKSVKTGFRAAVRRAGIDHVTIHDLRRTCAMWQAEKGVSIEEIAEWLGDSVAVARKHYAKYSPDYLNKGADALSDWG
jgi:integrase